MDWFSDPMAHGASERGRPTTISVLRDGDPVGAGVLLAQGVVLTCAHVVNEALRRDQFEHEHPGPRWLRLVVTRPDNGRSEVDAVLRTWIPPHNGRGGRVAEGALDWEGDLALLALDVVAFAPVRPARWRPMCTDQPVRAWFGAGHACGYVDSTVSELTGWGGYLDAVSGPRIGPGYSGGPLWSRAEDAVVGLVAGQLLSAGGSGDGFARRSLAFSWQTIHRELRQAGVDPVALTAPPAADEWELDARTHLAGWLGRRIPLTDDLAKYAKHLAKQCDLTTGDADPTHDEVAEALVRQRGALAVLVGALRAGGSPAAADELLALPAAAIAPGLLSPAESRVLAGLLAKAADMTGLGAPLLRRIAGEAGAVMDSPQSDQQPDLAAVVRQLEEFQGGFSTAEPGRRLVPVLLRVMEFVTAHLADQCGTIWTAKMLAWSGEVAERLGVPTAALHERRADAADWALRQGGPQTTREPRVLAYLTRHQTSPGPGGERYDCSIWTASGSGAPRRVQHEPQRARTPQDIARTLRELADDLWSGGLDGTSAPGPVIEVFLDRPDLALAVDEWDSAVPGDGADDPPEPLGMTHPLVVRLAVRSQGKAGQRAAGQQHRWTHRDSGELLLLGDECRTPQHLRARVFEVRETARAVLTHTSPDDRARWAAECLLCGVPLVLWDRRVQAGAGLAFFDGLALAGPADELVEEVRRYRSRVYGDPDRHPVRPVLAREDPTRPGLPVLDLVDPVALLPQPAEPGSPS